MISVRCSLAQSKTMHVVAVERMNISSNKPRTALSVILKWKPGCRCATAMCAESAISTSPSSCRDVGHILTSAAALIGNTPMVSCQLLFCRCSNSCRYAFHLPDGISESELLTCYHDLPLTSRFQLQVYYPTNGRHFGTIACKLEFMNGSKRCFT